MLVFALILIAKYSIGQVYTDYKKVLAKPWLVYKLDLSNQFLAQLPDSIINFTNMEILDVSGNTFSRLPLDFGRLKKLRVIMMNGCPNLDIKHIFKSLRLCPNIQYLYINKSKLTVLPREVGDIDSLKVLSITNNEIKTIPIEITKLTQIKEIDISGNANIDIDLAFETMAGIASLRVVGMRNLTKLPLNFDKMKLLESIDASGSNVDKLPSSIVNLKKLRTLLLNNCDLINAENLFDVASQIPSLFTFQYSSNTITAIPDQIGKMKKVASMTLGGKRITSISKEIANLKSLQKLVIRDSPSLDFATLINNIDKLADLKILGINECSLKQIPAVISEMKNLQVLDLKDNTISQIPPSISKLTGLLTLNLMNNQLPDIRVSELKSQLPECNILFDFKDPSYNIVGEGTSQSVSIFPPTSKNIKIPFDKWLMTTTAKKEFASINGTRVIIPANAFVTAEGKTYKGKATIHFRSLNEVLPMMLSGIPLLYDSNEMIYVFESAGAFELYAFSAAAEQLYLNKSAIVTVKYKCYNSEFAMNLYHWDQDDNNWVFQSKNKTIIKSKIIRGQGNALGIEDIPVKKKELVSPPLPSYDFKTATEQIRIRFSVKGKTPVLTISPYKVYKSNYIGKNGYKTFPELKMQQNIKWLYDGERFWEEYAVLKNLVNKRRAKVVDVALTKKPASENYELFVKFKKDSVYFDVKPDFGIYDSVKILKVNQQFDVNYMKEFTKRRLSWAKIDNNIQKEWDKYEKRMQQYKTNVEKFKEDSINEDFEYQKRIMDYVAKNADKLEKKNQQILAQSTRPSVLRTLYIDDFGVWGVHKLAKMYSPMRLNFEYVDKKGKILPVCNLYLLDDRRNSVTMFDYNETVSFDERSKNVLVGFFGNENLAYIEGERFDVIESTVRGHAVPLQLQIQETKKLNDAILKQILKLQ